MDMSLLLWGLVFGSVGMGLFMYGKKQGAPAPLVCGLALMAIPYFITNTILLVATGGALVAVPYFLRA
ncbi:MAG: hypothetical protein GC164_13605 [Phycisphaera sp.]|nr:hypothetical protein [Phycisphaera sp.]